MSTPAPNAPTPAQPASVAASRSGTPQKNTSDAKRDVSATDIFFVAFSGIAFALAVAGIATPVLEPYTGAGLRTTLFKTCTIINNEVVKGSCGSVQHACSAQKSVFQATQAMELIAVIGTGLLMLTSILDCLVMNIGCGAAPSGGIRFCGRLRLRGFFALVLSAFSVIGFALAFSIATKSHCPGRLAPTGTNGGYEVGPNAPLFVVATVVLLIMAIQDFCSTRPEEPEAESNEMEMSYVYGRAPGTSVSVAPGAVASGRASPALVMSQNTPHLQPQQAAPVARNGADTPLIMSSRGPSPMGGLPPPAPAKTAPALPVPVASVRVGSTTPSAAAPF